MTTHKDITTLTEFAPPPKEKNVLPRWWNPFGPKREDSIENINNIASSGETQRPPPDPRSTTNSPSLLARLKNFTSKDIEGPEAKKYWMPDNDAAVCYDCQTPFSVFTRRHHCRICGLLFCWRCSDHSIEDYQGSESPIRVCNFCYGLLHAPQSYNVESPDIARRESLSEENAPASPAQEPTGLHKLIYNTSFLKVNSPFGKKEPQEEVPTAPPENVIDAIAAQYDLDIDEDIDDYDDDDDSEDEEELVTSQLSNSVGMNRPITPRTSDGIDRIMVLPTVTSSGSLGDFSKLKPPSPSVDDFMSPARRRRTSDDIPDHDRPSTPRAGARSTSPSASFVPSSTSPGSQVSSSSSSSAFVHLAEASLQPLAQHPRVTNRDKSWAQFPLMRNGTLGLSVGAADEAQALSAKTQQRIDASAERHLVRLVSQLLSHGGLRGSWAPIILTLAREVCKRVKLNVRSGDKLNIRHYVKVKKIPGGNMQDCKYVDGVVITKNVTHKKMINHFTNPRILLLSCSLEYQRVEGRLLFFDSLIPQEKSYLKMLVAKIAALKPDLVLVEKTVSRYAQEFLLEEGITLTSNVKPHVMERLARQLRAELLPTLDILFTTTNYSLTSTSSLSSLSSLSSIPPPPTTAPVNNASTNSLNNPQNPPNASPPPFHFSAATSTPKTSKPALEEKGEDGLGGCGDFKIVRYQGDWGGKTLMHFEKCPKELGCTITIRGGSKEELARVKSIMLFCIYAAWSLHLERYLLLDEHATYQTSTDKNEKAYDLVPAFSISSQVEFQESSVPARLLLPHINSYTYTRTRYSSLHPQSKFYLLNSFQVPHSHSFFSHIEFPSLLQLQCTMEDDTPTICSCNHPFSIEPSPNPNQSVISPPSFPPSPPFSSSPSPALSSTSPAPISSSNSVSSSSLVAPVAMYPGRSANSVTSPANPITTTNTCNHNGPHAHGHSHTCTHEESHTAYSMQTLVYVHSFLCSTTATQCIPHEVHAIDYYSDNDIALGEFLETMCFDLARLCPVKDCNRPITQHERAFIHNNGRLNITVENVQRSVTPAGDPKGIYVSSYCKICKTATPFSPMSQETWSYSFGKFLELSFYCSSAINQAPECAHSVYRDHIRYFSCGYLVAQFAYEPIQRLHVILPPIRLEHDANVKLTLRRKELELLTQCADQVYDAILAKLTQLQTIAEGGGGVELAQQVATFVESLQKEKSIFMTKLGAAREHTDTKELRDLTRILYANFVMWNSMLNEVVNNANNVEAYKSKQNRKLNISSQALEVSPRFSRDISKQDLATIVEHASDLAQPISPSSSVITNNSISLSNSISTYSSSPAVSPQQPSISSSAFLYNSAPASASNSDPNSANSSYNNYTNVFSSSSTNGQQTTNGQTTSPVGSAPTSPTLPHSNNIVTSSQPPSSPVSRSLSTSYMQPSDNTQETTQPVSVAYDEVTKGEPEISTTITPAIQIDAAPSVQTPDLASPGMAGMLAQSPNSSKPAQKPSKIMNTITNLVSAISSTRILDPTIPYLFLPQGGHNDIIVAIYENEPSTIIAYTLSSAEFKEKFDQHYKEFQPPAATPAPVVPPVPIVTVPPRSRSSSLSKPANSSRSTSPTPEKETRSRSPSIVSAASAALASVKAVVTSNTEVSENQNPTISATSLAGPNSDSSESSESDNSSNGSLSNMPNISENPSITTTPAENGTESGKENGKENGKEHGKENGKENTKENGKENGKEKESTKENPPSPTPDDDNNRPEDQFQFTDRNVTLAKYLLCGDHREIRNKYQLDKHGNSITIYCTTYYPLQFNAMRELMAGGEDKFIESLSRCKSWNAKGGKSGALWAKTLDDRYVLKQVSRAELLSFVDFAPQYFEYLCKAFFHKVPTLMSKIFGVYSVRWKNGTKRDLIVMENLHYNTTCVQVYDLKGSLRGRLIENPINDSVLLDENLLQTNYTSPICITEYSKTILGQAVWNDTAFLSSLNVMDYSLLAGIGKNGELVVGIIDYIRRFTWDRQLENWVKIGLGRGKTPTVISPKQYKTRFRDAMWMYFVMVPTKFTRILHPPLPSNQQDKEKDKQQKY